jgi:hypothetical protein
MQFLLNVIDLIGHVLERGVVVSVETKRPVPGESRGNECEENDSQAER